METHLACRSAHIQAMSAGLRAGLLKQPVLLTVMGAEHSGEALRETRGASLEHRCE